MKKGRNRNEAFQNGHTKVAVAHNSARNKLKTNPSMPTHDGPSNEVVLVKNIDVEVKKGRYD